MKLQLIGITAILALTFSKIEAQTLGDSNVAGNEAGETFTTLGDTDVAGMEMPDTGSVKTEAEGTVEDNSSTTHTSDRTPMADANLAGHSGLDQSSSAPEAPPISADDVHTRVSTTDDSAPDDIDTKRDDGSSDASCIVFPAGVSLVAVTVVAML